MQVFYPLFISPVIEGKKMAIPGSKMKLIDAEFSGD